MFISQRSYNKLKQNHCYYLMRILLIEDDKTISQNIITNLIQLGFSIDSADNGNKGSYLARTNDYDLIVLDIGLPEKRGDEICKELRAADKTVPIIVLSVESELESKLTLLNSGADDYVTKPFHISELVARIRAILRRPQQIIPEIITIEDLSLNSSGMTVQRNGKTIKLTRKEFSLLEYLMKNQGKVLSRGAILEHVWDIHADIFSNTIETHILNLRRKIDKDQPIKLIHTVPGMGYKLDIII